MKLETMTLVLMPIVGSSSCKAIADWSLKGTSAKAPNFNGNDVMNAISVSWSKNWREGHCFPTAHVALTSYFCSGTNKLNWWSALKKLVKWKLKIPRLS